MTVQESSATPQDHMLNRDAPMINSNKIMVESEGQSSPARSVGIENQENEHRTAQNNPNQNVMSSNTHFGNSTRKSNSLYTSQV